MHKSFVATALSLLPAIASSCGPAGDANVADGGGSRADGAVSSSDSGATGGTLSATYPDDEGIEGDPAVIFHDDFEDGWGRWDLPTADTKYLHVESDADLSNGGSRYLRSTVTKTDLDIDEYISSAAHYTFPERVDDVYWRFYVRFKGIAPNPHHWVRMAAGDDSFSAAGLANTVPPGDAGFWFDLDADNSDLFHFYVYWYKMRSGRCNDGTTVPGCEGDQGTTYHYGNVFRPPAQTAFPRDQWFCIEIAGKTNTPGETDGTLAFWVDDQLVDEYRPGHPVGTWLRDKFYTGGCDYTACTEPAPFEGFDFRSSNEVRFKKIFLDAYYERGSFERKKAELEAMGLTVSDEQTIYYDDIVVATERIGCKVARAGR